MRLLLFANFLNEDYLKGLSNINLSFLINSISHHRMQIIDCIIKLNKTISKQQILNHLALIYGRIINCFRTKPNI